MTEKWVQRILAVYNHSPVCMWQQLIVLPNCQTPPLEWEADLLSISRAGFATEVEIKVTLSDWKADQHKGKHDGFRTRKPVVKKFYYAGPIELMKRYNEVWTRPGSGIIGIEYRPASYPRIEILRPAEVVKDARKLTQEELIRMGRTAAVRYWTWAHCDDELQWKDKLCSELSQSSPASSEASPLKPTT